MNPLAKVYCGAPRGEVYPCPYLATCGDACNKCGKVHQCSRCYWTTERRRAVRDRVAGFVIGLLLLAIFAALAGCASTAEHRAVQALAAGAELHRTTMEAAGYAAETGALTPEQLAEVRTVGRRVELVLRAAQASLDIYLVTRGAGTAGGLDAQLAEVQGALLELVRVAVAAGLEVGQ